MFQKRWEGGAAAGVALAAAGWILAACALPAVEAASAEADATARAEASAAADPLLAEMGRETFQQRCASCHGWSGRGDGPAAASLRTPPADLTRIAARRGGEFPSGAIARTIDGRFELAAHGTREMPVWGERLASDVPDAGLAEQISRGHIVSLVEYLKSIQTSAPADASETRARMAEVFAAMQVLLPLAFEEQRFADPENSERVSAALDQLASGSTRLEAHGVGRDAGFAYLSHSLAIDARDIASRYQQGHVREARYLVQTLAETCVACHSRLPAERDAPQSLRFVDDTELATLPLSARAKLAYATRQFGRALTLYETLFALPDASTTDFDLDGQLDDYLELSLHVRRDPGRARSTIEKLLTRPDLGQRLRREATHWVSDLGRLEKRTGEPRDVLAFARAAVAAAADPTRYDDERAALVAYLDTSGVLHRAIADAKLSGPALAEAYYWLGEIETRIGRTFWLSQAEAFLEAAIRTAPHSELAETAYATLEDFLVAGFSGSAGTNVPPDIAAKLDELNALASRRRAPAKG